ncbi:MAG: septum formation initiator family protein [Candidatus Omnitrophica bacterium]|nr:septum formation initiator family protein [Candidatus Omnitrophota bacterium]
MEKKKIIWYVVILSALICVIFLPGLTDLHKLRAENEKHKKRIQLLEERNDELKEELLRLQKDPVYVEKKAREKLGIVKKGEIIYKGPSKKK